MSALSRLFLTTPLVVLVALVHSSSLASAGEPEASDPNDDDGWSENGGGKGGGTGGGGCTNPCGEGGVQSDTPAGCPANKCLDRMDTVICTPATPPGGNHTNAFGTWQCSGQPHANCTPNPTNGGNATHTHHDLLEYNFSAPKKCCFLRKKLEGCGDPTDRFGASCH